MLYTELNCYKLNVDSNAMNGILIVPNIDDSANHKYLFSIRITAWISRIHRYWKIWWWCDFKFVQDISQTMPAIISHAFTKQKHAVLVKSKGTLRIFEETNSESTVLPSRCVGNVQVEDNEMCLKQNKSLPEEKFPSLTVSVVKVTQLVASQLVMNFPTLC